MQNHLSIATTVGVSTRYGARSAKAAEKCPTCLARAATAWKGGTRSSDASNTTSGGGKVVGPSPGNAEWQLTVRCRFLGVAGARSERPQTDPTSKGPCQERPQLLQSRSREHGSRLGRPTPRAQADRPGRWPFDGARRSRTARRLSGSTSATVWRGCYVA